MGSVAGAGISTAGLGASVAGCNVSEAVASSGGIPRFYSTVEPCLGRLTQQDELIE